MNISNFSLHDLSPPSQLPLEYIQIGFFAFMVLLGVPLNFLGLFRTVWNRHSRSSWTAMEVLKIHLSVTDLMILFFFTLSKLIWWSTYQWMGGEMLCKLIQFMSAFAFYSCSNLIALIGLIRLMAVKCLITTVPFYPKRFGLYICTVYGLSFSLSLPQLFVWCVLYPFTRFPDWAQCVTKWGADRWTNEQFVNYHEEEIYELVHLLFVFWIPLIVVCFSYLGVLIHLKRNIKANDLFLTEFQNHYKTRISESQIESDGLSFPINTSVRINSSDEFSYPITIPVKKYSDRSLSICTLTKAKNNMMKKTAYILLAYVLCWSSYNITALLEYLGIVSVTGYWRMLYNFIVLNAVVNPFVYGM